MPFGAFGRGGLVERCRVVDDQSGAWDLFPVFCALFRDQVEPVERLEKGPHNQYHPLWRRWRSTQDDGDGGVRRCS